MINGKKIVRCVILNTVVPGLGQVCAGHWLAGVLLIIASIGCFLWALWLLVVPMFRNIVMLCSDSRGDMCYIDLPVFGVACGGLLLLWVLSVIGGIRQLSRDGADALSREDKE